MSPRLTWALPGMIEDTTESRSTRIAGPYARQRRGITLRSTEGGLSRAPDSAPVLHFKGMKGDGYLRHATSQLQLLVMPRSTRWSPCEFGSAYCEHHTDESIE